MTYFLMDGVSLIMTSSTYILSVSHMYIDIHDENFYNNIGSTPRSTHHGLVPMYPFALPMKPGNHGLVGMGKWWVWVGVGAVIPMGLPMSFPSRRFSDARFGGSGRFG
jgi:hypothetical protein